MTETVDHNEDGLSKEEALERDAAEWFTTLHSGEVTREIREAFEVWLHGDRARKIAYREFEQVYRDLDYVAFEAGVDLDEALDRKRGLAVLIADWLRKPALAVTLALGVIATVSVISYTALFAPPSTSAQVATSDYATGLGEIRDVTLEDGTVITLGAKSEVTTDFTATARRVTLLEGEAFFEVTKDPGRPFFVAAQDTLVRVVGTKFDVKRSAEIVHVSVLEGVVEVMKPDNIERMIDSGEVADIGKQVLIAGERVSSARRVALPEVRQVEQAPPGAWREGRLAYEDASLAEIVADLNRYYDKPVRIASSDVGDLRSTLAFQTSDVDQFFDVVESIQPVKVDRTGSREIVIRRR
ncbi:FecR family protein [Hyphococcus luteus]|uniref:FecR protein domain-containing protein n=1 Tax=Hyphococcus luteus TaxID=2058213 RepID=A0A2S7KAS4_9PROT|nr:FecR domain-containing protein [Marinicaulis flavus]PQA89602.1 hypothetical protein CW354_01680 [Marinicaulis flavus]